MVVTHLVIIMLDQDLVGQTEMVQPEVPTVVMVVDLIAMVAGITILLVSLVMDLKMVVMVVTDNMVESAALVVEPADMVEPVEPDKMVVHLVQLVMVVLERISQHGYPVSMVTVDTFVVEEEDIGVLQEQVQEDLAEMVAVVLDSILP